MLTMPIDKGTKSQKHGKILVGMSGGVDSTVASLILARQGWQVSGLSLLTSATGSQNLEDAEAVCRQLGIAWHFLDVSTFFHDKIIRSFIDSYMAGLTPNPCVICNAEIKFLHLLEAAERLGCEAVATGHYARIVRMPQTGRLALGKTTDSWKDQSYFLYRLTQQQLERLVFPLAGLDKATVRHMAGQADLLGKDGGSIADRPDSQDICFINDGDYADFIIKELGKDPAHLLADLAQPGPVINHSGQTIGSHRGLIHYTVGQRKGFSVQTTERLFVVEKCPESNSLVVGSYSEILRQEIHVEKTVYSGLREMIEGEKLEARIRNSAREVPCRVYPEGQDSLRVVFDQPVAAPAPGQSCVFYREGVIMAGGVITGSQ
jgi:tRNA-uridine 2-sulfurtransferase